MVTLTRSRVAARARLAPLRVAAEVFLAPLRVAAKRSHSRALLLSIAATALLFAGLGSRELVSSHEARAAQVAQRMLDTGDWGLPTLFDGRSDFQKPPGFYWAVAALGWVNGGTVTEWTARLPAALAGLGCVVLVYAFLWGERRPRAALAAAIVLATANHFTSISRTARIDVPLAFFVAASLLAFVQGCKRAGSVSDRSASLPSPLAGEGGGAAPPGEGSTVIPPDASPLTRRASHGCPLPQGERAGKSLAHAPGSPLAWHVVSALAAGVAVLLKGPVALALIGPAAVVWLLAERRHTPVRLPLVSAILGPLVVAGVALPWFLWANATTDGEFLRVFFWYHNVARFTGSATLLASHPWWYYAPRFAADFLPWTPLLVGLVGWGLRSGRWHADPAFRFGLVASVVMVGVLSAARFKRADYLLPAYPFAAIALGCVGEAWLTTRTGRGATVAKWAFALCLAAAVVGWAVMTTVVEPREQGREGKRRFAGMIRSHAPPPNRILQFRMESHLLSFHLGRPVHTLVEWGDLNEALAEPGPHFVVMPPEYVYATERIVTSRKLVAVARLEDYTAGKPRVPLVFLRTE